MSNWSDDPSPWWHLLIVNPIFFVIFWFGDNYLLRKYCGLGFWCILCMLPFPFISYATGVYTSGSRAIMLLLKAEMIVIPVLLINWFRLANDRVNTDKNELTCNEDEITDEAIAARKEQYERNHRWVPQVIYDKLLYKYFTSHKGQRIIAYCFYFFLAINYLEPMYFEGTSDNALGNKLDWSKYLNVYSGFILILIQPFPFEEIRLPWKKDKIYKFKSFWYFDTVNAYNDLVMFCENTKEWYYFGYLYPILFSTWYLEFAGRFIRETVHITIFYHVFLPLIRSWFKDNIQKEFAFGLWVQARAQEFAFFITFVIFLRDVVFETKMEYLWYPLLKCDGYILFGFTLFTSIFSTIYAIIWFGFYLPAKVEVVDASEQLSTVVAPNSQVQSEADGAKSSQI